MSTEPNNSIDWEQQRGHVNLDLLRENAELRANVARLREKLRSVLDSTPYHAISCPLSEETPCNCHLGKARGDAEDLLAETPAASLAAIQDAARAEERAVVCKAILDGILALNPSSWILPAIEDAISKVSRGNGGEATCE